MQNGTRKNYLVKIKMVSIILVVCFMAASVTMMSKIGVLFVSPKDFQQSRIAFQTVKNDKARYEKVMGDIVDRNGMPIAVNTEVFGEQGYVTYPESYSYILGNVNLEDDLLLNSNWETLMKPTPSDKSKGHSMTLTINSELQSYIYGLIEDTRTSAVVLKRNSGELMALVSSYGMPFNLGCQLDDQTLEKYNSADCPIWMPSYLTDNMAPGSVYKIFTSALMLENGNEGYKYEDTGKLEFEDEHTYIENNNGAVYGNLDLETAFVNSVNTYFGSAYMKSNINSIRTLTNNLMLNETVKTDFGDVTSGTVFYSYSPFERASTGFGQGNLQINSVSLAMMTQGVIDGKIYRPHVTSNTFYTNEEGAQVIVDEVEEEIISDECVSPKTSEKVSELMKDAAFMYGLPEDLVIGSKTGTADINEGTRATMIGFNENYIVVLSRISPEGLYGGSNQDNIVSIFGKLSELGA